MTIKPRLIHLFCSIENEKEKNMNIGYIKLKVFLSLASNRDVADCIKPLPSEHDDKFAQSAAESLDFSCCSLLSSGDSLQFLISDRV
ncbi:hypothetical protein KP509_31G042000 [Ceratopteris richardii]|uniref:Uncharacterized protein n=1 Tax=Ceratopteris richardii TaxID=49495 RepID=A0A8T2QYP6_CERRI|nr:hypothetical protein KP509_31G042000 [Ceratopteris richardii]